MNENDNSKNLPVINYHQTISYSAEKESIPKGVNRNKKAQSTDFNVSNDKSLGKISLHE